MQEHKEFYDKKVTLETRFQPKQRVWLSKRDPHTSKDTITTLRPSQKLEHRRFGPFEIIEPIGNKAYRLKLPPTMKIHPVFHISRLSPFKEDVITGRSIPPMPPIETEQGEEYEVEAIIDACWKKTRGKPKFQYLVAWKGYGPSDNSWADLSDVANASDAVADFHSTNPNAPHPAHPPIDR